MRFYARLASEGERPLSPTTIAHTHSLINSAMKWAHRKGRTNRNRTRQSGSRPLPLNTREFFPVRVFAFSMPPSPFESRRVLGNPLDSVWGVKSQDRFARWLLVDTGMAVTSPTPDVGVKGALGLKDAVSQNQEATHDGGDDLLAMLARRSQPTGKIFEDGIAADRRHSRHIQHPPQMSVASL